MLKRPEVLSHADISFFFFLGNDTGEFRVCVFSLPTPSNRAFPPR